MSDPLRMFPPSEKAVYALIAGHDGLKAREIASFMSQSRFALSRTEVNRILSSSALMREMCYQSKDYRWHALLRDAAPHEGLYEFSGWYGTAGEFLSFSDDAFLSSLQDGCRRIGRSLSDTRGLLHSFADCRQTLLVLFDDLTRLLGPSCLDWELAFEFRLNRARFIRLFADVLVFTPRHLFSLEFKMKNAVDPAEVLQAAKYIPFLDLLFPSLDAVPALVLTRAADLFSFVPIGDSDAVLPVASGDMLFNVFNEYLGFLR